MNSEVLITVLIDVEIQTMLLLYDLRDMETRDGLPSRTAVLWEAELEAGVTWEEAFARDEEHQGEDVRATYKAWLGALDRAEAEVTLATWMDSESDPPPRRWTTQCRQQLMRLRSALHPVSIGENGRGLRPGQITPAIMDAMVAEFRQVESLRQQVQAVGPGVRGDVRGWRLAGGLTMGQLVSALKNLGAPMGSGKLRRIFRAAHVEASKPGSHGQTRIYERDDRLVTKTVLLFSVSAKPRDASSTAPTHQSQKNFAARSGLVYAKCSFPSLGHRRGTKSRASNLPLAAQSAGIPAFWHGQQRSHLGV